MGGGGRGLNGPEEGESGSHPQDTGENGQVRTDTKEPLERPKHPSAERKRNRRHARTAASKEPSNRAETPAGLGVKEQCLEASPLRDQISVTRGPTSSI